jgi:hypothetical protein
MVWLGLGTLLLVFVAIIRCRARWDALAIVAVAFLGAIAIASPWTYPFDRAAAGLGIGALGGAAAGLLARRIPTPAWLGWIAVVLGIGAGLMALLGPADGLFREGRIPFIGA